MRPWLAMLAMTVWLSSTLDAQPLPRKTLRYTLHLSNSPLKAVFDYLRNSGSIRISKQTKYDTISGINVQVVDGTVENILDQALRGLPLSYSERQMGDILEIDIRPSFKASMLPAATVKKVVQNGLDPVKVANFTGSQSTADGDMIEREVDGDLFANLDGLLSSWTMGGANNGLGHSVRGNSTLLGSGTPLLVMGRFAWPGNPRDINRHDVELVTLLKDAVGAGIWGAYSGNGVLVLTPREGAYEEPRLITLTVNTTWTGKPALSYPSRMSPRSYINADSTLFLNGFFNSHVYDPSFVLPPSVAIMQQQLEGTITPTAANAAIAALGNHNIVQDLDRYYYRASVRQEYHLRMEGGTPTAKYYASAGYERDPTDLVRNSYQRITALVNYGTKTKDNKLEALFTGNMAALNVLLNNAGDVPVSYPYAALADANGRPLAVNYGHNPLFLDTSAASYPLDWHYRPLQELALADDRYGRLNFCLQGLLSYHILHGLVLETSGQWMHEHSYTRNNYDKDGYFVRDLVNTYSAPQENGFALPVPDANILVAQDTSVSAYNLRGKLKYSHMTRLKNKWSIMVGAEMSDVEIDAQAQRIYGHDGPAGSTPVDLASSFPTRPGGGYVPIPDNDQLYCASNRAVSVFSNGAYSWKHGFDLYGALRWDASNIVGVTDNRKGAFFWSVGAARWLAGDSGTSKAARKWASLLKARLSLGCNGNVSNRTADLTTEYLGLNPYGAQQAGIDHYPDPTLSWEKVYIVNAGIDYGFFRDSSWPAGRLSGSLDVYQRWAVNLLCQDSLPLSAGVPFYTANNAGIIGQGIDLVVRSVNVANHRKKVYWFSDLLLSINRDWVYKYPYQALSASAYVTGGFVQKGKPSTALYTYGWAGLSQSDGSPQGRMGSQISTNYDDLMNNAGGAKVFSGVWQPVVTTSLLNTVEVGALEVSARFDCRTGYSVRRPSIQYYALAMNNTRGTADYDQRWLYTGQKTEVPSMPAKLDPNQDLFYANAQVLVMRADNIRWRDLRVAYDVKTLWKQMPFRSMLFYVYVNNLMTVWKANHYGLDPDATQKGIYPATRTYSVGTQIKI